MPKIAAETTVREHRERMLATLVDAAERILVEGGELTASAVVAEAGLARNSLYRYVGHVDDLKVLVVARYLPAWSQAVDEAVRAHDDPRDRALAYVRQNLAEAAVAGHGRLMSLVATVDPASRVQLAEAHVTMARTLGDQVRALGAEHPALVAAVVDGILATGFAALDRGEPLEVVEQVVTTAVAATLDAVRTR